MGLWGMKYSDADDKWWVDLVLQDAPPAVRLEQVGGRVVADGFDGVTQVLLAKWMCRIQRRAGLKETGGIP